MLFDFGHHRFSPPSLLGKAGSQGDAGRSTLIKETCRNVLRIQGALAMADRTEIIVADAEAQLFAHAASSATYRRTIWDTVRSTPRLEWVILTRKLEFVSTVLPPNGIGIGYANVCLGLVARCGKEFSSELAAFRNMRAKRRMILLSPESDPISMEGSLTGIDWVVFSGIPENCERVHAVALACAEAKVHFLWHRSHMVFGQHELLDDTGNNATLPQ
ncbi:MAG: DUF5131 family protein, partial [Verrucomicrobiaceae bacterium]